MATAPKKTTKSKTPAPEPTPIKENVSRGVLFALGAPLAGIVMWVVLWRMGFIASLVSFVIASLTVFLYKKGAGTLSRKSAPIVVAIAVIGVILSFLAGVISDGTAYYAEQARMNEQSLLFNAAFWEVMGANFADFAFWSEYKWDLLMSLLFAGLGMFGTVRDVLFPPAPATEPVKKTA